tara:strand:+ start:156 stop:539 length:384 start_codon:yes stop_codon:yes gene_type:complete
MKLDQAIANKLMEQVVEVTNAVAMPYGVQVRKRQGRYTDLELKLTITLAGISDTGETQQQRDYRSYASTYGLNPSWLGEAVILPSGRWVEVTGFNRSAKKNKVLLRDLNTDCPRICSPDLLSRSTLV